MNTSKQIVSQSTRRETRCKRIGSANGILNREVNPHPSHRAHRMDRVANRQQAGLVPMLQSIERNGEQFDQFPVRQRSFQIGKARSNAAQFFPKSIKSASRIACALPFAITDAHCQ